VRRISIATTICSVERLLHPFNDVQALDAQAVPWPKPGNIPAKALRAIAGVLGSVGEAVADELLLAAPPQSLEARARTDSGDHLVDERDRALEQLRLRRSRHPTEALA
jgi:hypothetical protein